MAKSTRQYLIVAFSFLLLFAMFPALSHATHYELDLGRGNKVLTHVIWAEPEE